MSEKIEPHNAALAEDGVVGKALTQADKRQTYVEGLLEKAQHFTLSREEALIILQGILADMLGQFQAAVRARGGSDALAPGVQAMSTCKWCVNCGKDQVRCKCKRPVINSEKGKIEGTEGERKTVKERAHSIGLSYGAGVRG